MGNTALRCCQSPALGPGSGEVSPLAWPTGQEGSFHCRVPLFLAKGCEVGVSWNESRGPGGAGDPGSPSVLTLRALPSPGSAPRGCRDAEGTHPQSAAPLPALGHGWSCAFRARVSTGQLQIVLDLRCSFPGLSPALQNQGWVVGWVEPCERKFPKHCAALLPRPSTSCPCPLVRTPLRGWHQVRMSGL